jgi:uncharacterized protein YjbJ (UPF0337 family)
MKFNINHSVKILQPLLKKSIARLLVLAVVWQGIIFGVAPAIASPLFATSADSMSKQMSGKAEQANGSAKESIGKMQSEMEDRSAAAKMQAKDNLNKTKAGIEANSDRAENAVEEVAEKVKDFFGK